MCLSDLENHCPKVDIKREKNLKSLVKDPKFETTLIQQNQSDRSPCDVCKEKKRQGSTSFGEKSVIAISSLFTKDLLEKQKSWSQGGKMQIEPENKSTLSKIHAKSPKGNGIGIQNEEKQLSETSTSLSDEKQWHDVSVYLGVASCPGSRQPDKLDVESQDDVERSGLSCCHKNETCLGESDMYESKCCHPSDFIIEAPGHMSDMEWMSIFKPSKVQRIVRHKSVCTCSESAGGRKYNSATRLVMFPTAQHHCWGVEGAAVAMACSLLNGEQCLQTQVMCEADPSLSPSARRLLSFRLCRDSLDSHEESLYLGQLLRQRFCLKTKPVVMSWANVFLKN